MGATAFLASDGADGGDFRHIKHILQLEGGEEVPVEDFLLIGDVDLLELLLEAADGGERFLHALLGAEDADVLVHADAHFEGEFRGCEIRVRAIHQRLELLLLLADAAVLVHHRPVGQDWARISTP